MVSSFYPRDLIGYGPNPPDPQWPGGARIALNFVVNYEEGGENCVLHGDQGSETAMPDPAAMERKGSRNLAVESVYEYGSRVGIWRLLRLFGERKVHFTAFAIGMALERHPAAACAMAEAGHEIATHGYRWIDYANVPEAIEREHVRLAVQAGILTCGQRPLGWFQGRCSMNSLRLAVEEGGFVYCSDTYADDLPYWVEVAGKPILMVPYTLDNNDVHFTTTVQSFSSGEQFFTYLKDAFDYLYQEGQQGRPQMMSVGVHARVVARPGRMMTLQRFLDYVLSKDRVWVARRIDIARHWIQQHPYRPQEEAPAVVGRPAAPPH